LDNMKMITRDIVSCWYELSWRGEQSVVLRIHTDFVKGVGSVSANSPIIKHYNEGFGFKKFGREFGKDFGFENSLKFLTEADGFLEYLVPTHLVRKDTGKKCYWCKGSSKSDMFDGEGCMHCDGEGKEIVYDYTEAWAVSASLSLLFEFMRFPQIETSCSFSQLMCIHTVTIKGSHGGSLGGEYSPVAVDWMRRRGPSQIPEMVSAMRVAWEKMDGRMKDFYRHSFRANLSNDEGWLCVDCPGDACGLHPSDHWIDGNSGYRFSCHNTDQPMQQMTLLASLAVLNDLIRKGTHL